MPRNALGKGLRALIREPEETFPPQAPTKSAPAAVPALQQVEGMLQVDIDLIDPSPFQPRSTFREEALEELARSIRGTGIVQPLVVRRVGRRFQLIVGERRWRAAQRAGLARVPAVLRDLPEEKALEMTLVENLQREDLNPIEQARAFQRLSDEFSLTQEEVAERTGKDRATISNAVRLLKLDEAVQDLLEEGRLSAGHGRALLAITDQKTRIELARRIVRRGMTVRQVERLAARGSRPRIATSSPLIDANARAALEELQRAYGTRVLIHQPRAGKPGQVIFEYYEDSDLSRLYDRFMLK